MGWTEKIRLIADEARQRQNGPWEAELESMPFVDKMRAVAERAKREAIAHPWELVIGRLRGKVGSDQIERLSTTAIFDALEVPMTARTSAACVTVARLMRAAGWSPVRFRCLTPGSWREQVRGYAREVTRASTGLSM
jgi:hypothetical protein